MALDGWVLCGALSLFLLIGCGKTEGAEPNEPASRNTTSAQQLSGAPAEAKAYFAQKCALCHGENGGGNGPGAAALTPKPPSFRNKAWHKTVDDDHLKKIILEGGPAVGKSPLMPGNPDLEGKEEVIAELVKVVRKFGD